MLTVVAVVASLSASGAASSQTWDPDDFRLSVAYCLGTRTEVIKEIKEYQRPDCMADGLPDQCDFDRQVVATAQSEAERLQLYLSSKFGDGVGGSTDVMATERGIADISNLNELTAKSCNSVSEYGACIESVFKANPLLAATRDRVHRCAEIIRELRF